MIVKNEEKFLPTCLESVRHCADEIVIVDTGSTDRTIEIAESFGAVVHHHPWENDFSKHRNQSIDYAKGDWIFWLDADESLEPGGGINIRNAIAAEEVDSLFVTMVCYFGNRTRESWNNTVKLFRNHKGIHFEGAVHNQVRGNKQPGFCPVKIYHAGYDVDLHTVKRKFERTSSLLLDAIRKDPENFRHHHDLAVSYASVRMHRKALQEAFVALRLYEAHGARDPNHLWTHFVAASSFFNLGRLKEAREISEAALRVAPDHLDSYFVLASVYAAEKDRNGFEHAYKKYRELVDKFTRNPEALSGLVVNKISETWRLDLENGALFLQEGEVEMAREWFEKGIRKSHEPATAYKRVVHACSQAGRYSLAESFLEAAAKAGTSPRSVVLERAIMRKALGDRSGYLSLLEELLSHQVDDSPEFLLALATEALKSGRYQKAEQLLLQSLKAHYDIPVVFTSLALACKYQGRFDEAYQWNLRALEMDDTDIHACANLAHLYYDQKKWREAMSWYRRVLEIDDGQGDVLFRLSLIALMQQDLPGCVHYCNRLSETMGISFDMEIATVKDLSLVYRTIGKAFLDSGNSIIYREATRFADGLLST